MRILWVFVITTCCFGVKIWNLIRYIVDFELTPMTPDIVQFVCILSTQGGYAFIFLDTQRIYNPFVWIMSVFRVCCMCFTERSSVFFKRCVFVVIETRSHRHSSTLIDTHRHLATSSNTLSLSLIITWRVFPKHLKKKLSSSKPVNKRPPRLSLII